MNEIVKPEHAGECLGVKGRFHNVIGDGKVIRNQKFISEQRLTKDKGRIRVEIRFDDECKNGHETFAITANINYPDGGWSGGCCHEEIAAAFPEFAPLIKWHLCSTDGPMHYVANTVYHASDRDYRGLLKGEQQQLRNGRTKQPVWECYKKIDGKVEKRWVDSDEKPDYPGLISVEPVMITGEGKERQLEFARSSAVWPEATDEQLCGPKEVLEALLKERLPALLAEFKEAMIGAGFMWPTAE